MKSGQPIRTAGKNVVGLWKPSFVKVDHQLFVFGGGGNVTNDLHVLNLCDMQWETIQNVQGSAPCKRYGHTATRWNNCIIVFGGCNDLQEYCDDIHIFDLCTLTWEQPNVRGIVPARYLHSAVVFDDKLFIYGGFAKSTDCTYVLEELSVLDLKTYTWTRYKDMPARYNHSATLVGQKMYIYGGKDEQGHTVSDLYMVHLKAPPYAPHLLLGGTQTHSGSKMVLMKSQHFCDTMCGKLLIFGRYISKSQPSKHTNDQTEASYSLWLLDLDTLEWSRQECGGYFEIGGWNYFTVISESSTKGDVNNLLFLGNTDPYRPQGYDHFRDALLINGESLGLYDVATRPFPNDFVCLLNNPELSDFVIIPADGQKIYVHQVILIARWPHFQNMYRSGMAESLERQMEVPESYSVVMAFVRYLYTDSLDEHETWPVVCEVLVLANMYLLTRLKKLCCERLYRRHLSVGSCGLIFETAIVAEETGLKLLVLDFIFQNYGAILKSNMLMQVPLSVRQEFLEAVPDEAVLEVGRMRYRSIKSGPTGGLVSVTHPQSHSQQHPPTSSYSSANNSLTQNYDHSTSALAATVSM